MLLHPGVQLLQRLPVVRRIAEIVVPTLPRLPGSPGPGRSSAESQKSTACSAISWRVNRASAWRLASPRDTSAGRTSRPSARCPWGTRSRHRRSTSRSGRGSSGIGCGSSPSRSRGRRGCCGRRSCVRPGRIRWRDRWMPVVGAGRAGASRSSPHRPTRRRSTREPLLAPVDVGDDRRHGAPGRVGLQPPTCGVAHQRDVVVREGWADGDHVGVGLRVHQAREPVAGRAADAPAERGVRLVQHDPVGRVEGVQTDLAEIVEQFLDARLVRHRRVRVWRFRRSDGSSPRIPCTW